MKFSDLKDRVLNSKKVIVYGAGCYGSVAVEYLLKSGLCTEKNILVVVTKVIEDNYVQNIKVEQIQDATSYENVFVIVAVSKEKQQDILETLENYNFSEFFLMNEMILNYMKRKIRSWNEDRIRNDRIIDKLNNEIQLCNADILSEINFNRVIAESVWLKRKDFSSGGMAVNAKFLYIMYKILDTGRFTSILDIGMGQTTKMINQYVNYNSKATHLVIENDMEWIDFFSDQIEILGNTSIVQLDYQMSKFQEAQVRTFANFKEKLKGNKFDYIVIDAPFGGDMIKYSRIDILDILPNCLCDSWIIMFDDVGRSGEANTLKLLHEKLNEANIAYVEKMYYGAEKTFAILTSKNNKFFCTV